MGKEYELLEAARTGNYAIVDKLLNYRGKRSGPLASLRRGPSPNTQDSSGYSSLHHATLNGHKEIVRLLLDYEASSNITDTKGLAPLHLAAWSGNCDIVHLLLEHRPRITNVNQLTREKESALHYASQYGHQEVVELLLEHGCDPTLKNSRNETALDLASQYGRFETVQVLLYKKPELIKAMRKPTQHIILVQSPLHLASRSGHKDIVELLLNSGFYINLKTRAGTALHEAALCGKLDVVRILLDHRIDLSITSDKGKTVLDLLQQFPTQISYDVMRLIESYRNNDENFLPSIPVQENRSNSPYDNVRQNCNHNKFTTNSPDTTPFKWDLADDDFHENFRISTNSIGSGLSLYQMKQTQDDYLICNNMANSNNPGIELDQISYSSTTSSSCFSRDFNQRKCEFSSGPISYSGHSPNSLNIKLSPTESKKPHRRNLSISPSRPSNTAILSSSTKSNEIETNSSSSSSSYRLRHVHSMDQYVNMANKKDYLNCISTMPLKKHDYVLQRGKSEELFERKYRQCQLEPIAITEIYDDTCIKKLNPKRRLKRNKQISKNNQHDELINNNNNDNNNNNNNTNNNNNNSSLNSDNIKTVICLPPTVQQAENLIFQTIQLLNQQLNKKDAETEIENCYIHSKQYESSSLSSNFSDKSNHNIEQIPNKNPFSGLLKGSNAEVNSKHYCNQTADKSVNLHNNCDTEKAINGADGNDPLFDEQEEWNQIESIMESFGTGFIHESLLVDELEKEFQNRLMGISLTKKLNDHCISTPATIKVPPPTIGKWLKSIGFENWEMKFITNGFDDVEFINGVLDEDDVRDLGIRNESDIKLIIKSVEQLPNKIKEIKLFYKEYNQKNNNNEIDNNLTIIDQWLNSIHLEQYYETFRKHLYIDFEKIQRIWDIELSTILEIEKSGHRKRILISVSDDNKLQYRPKLEDINDDLKTLKTNIQQLKQDLDKNEQKIKHKSKKSRPAPPPPILINKEKFSNELLTIRDPEELLIGKKPNKNKITEWKHEPIILVTGSIAYIANYLGSTIVHELKGTDSTKQSIEKLKRSKSNPKPTPEVILSISVRGVQFLNTITQELICEHDIKNIHCVCQDDEDLTHFAYITKDLDSQKHYCHVFSMKTTQDAAEVILTLGEAFEVAYQMKLKDENQTKSTNFTDKSQSLSQSVVLENNTDNILSNWNRPRSYSENEIKTAQKF